MSADDDLYSGDSDQDGDQNELARLNALHDDLVEAVQTAINPTVRADLAAELRSVRERIAELSIADGSGGRRAPEPGHTVHSYEVPPSAVDSNGMAGGYPAGGDGYGDDRYTMPGRHEHPGLGEAPAYGYQQQPDHGPGPGPGPASAGDGRSYVSDPTWNRQPAMGEARPQGSLDVRTRPQKSSPWSSRPWLPLVLAILGGLALAAIVGFGGVFRGGDDDADTVASEEGGDPAGASSAAGVVGEIRSMLDGMGFAMVGVEERDGSVALTGSVASDADRQAVIGAASALAGGLAFDSSGLTVAAGDGTGASTDSTVSPSDPAAVMQRELDRILAGTPIVFERGQVAVTERHQVILNNVVATMSAYPNQSIVVVGYTDDQGTPEANEQLSSARAQNVKDYLVSQGVPSERLDIAAVGEAEATGVAGLANLERRVEFEVVGASTATAGGLRVGVVAPSASNDLAFTQSMVDAMNLVAAERGIEVAITDNTFVESDAAAAIRGYADQGFDLVIAHGSQFGAALQEIAPQYPGVTFAWGTASDTFGFPNIYAYDAKAEQGGYVLGAIASQVTSSSTVGVVGPLEVGDAALYVNGFVAGAEAEGPGTTVRVDYIGSFSDIALAAESANGHLDAGADVMTGSAQMVVGAVDVAATRGSLWFGTQSNQASLAPEIVVASQVYRWDILLRPILDDIAAGRVSGTVSSLTLANGGLVIEYGDGYSLAPDVRQRADQLVAEIISGVVVPPG